MGSKPLSEMSVAKLYRRGLSSTIIKQSVFLTDLKIVLSSIRGSVLRPITSVLIDYLLSSSAASSAECLVLSA